MIISARPTSALQLLIRYYYQVDVRLADGEVVHPVPARSPQALEFMFGTPFEVRRLHSGVVEDARPIALIGAQTFRRVDLVMRGSVDSFTIVFRPGGLLRVFGVPADVLTDDDFEAESAVGSCVHDLYQRLGGVASFEARVRVADEFLSRRALALEVRDPIVQAAAFLAFRDGCLSVSALARSSGIGMRQFERRFKTETGITPKLYARIVRFEAALRLKVLSPATRWTDVAHVLGYYDQMHMVHDFRELAGDTPTSISGQLDMFVQPEVLSGPRQDRND